MKTIKKPIFAATVASFALFSSAQAGPGCATGKQGVRTAAMYQSGYVYPARPMHAGYGYAEAKPTAIAGDLVDTANSAGFFGTLIAAIEAAGLVDVLRGDGPFTVFAPSDAAFAKLPEGTLESLLADKARLTQILTYHVVPGKLDSKAVAGVSRLATVEGSELAVADIAIAKTDIMADNGVIHVIDEVLIPSS